MKIGVDFGSTYSVVSQYDPIADEVEAITFSEGAPASIPSVVSISDEEDIDCGIQAKELMGDPNVRTFEAFKMLLNEPSQEMLRRRGYDDTYTPRLITKYFLEDIVNAAMGREDKESVEKLVICIPEIWGNKLNTLDGRAILRDVLQNEVDLPISQVQVVTEPEAASAYIAYNYEKETKKSFNGHLLLIDFGGGTLDLTLTQVASTGSGSMEIGYREGGGAGENHPNRLGSGSIGKAGIAYMQGVILLALRSAGLLSDEDEADYTEPGFMAAVKTLESQLKSHKRMDKIEDIFGSLGSYSDFQMILDMEPMKFVSVTYNGKSLPITYQHLYLAYRDIIEDVLASELQSINRRVAQHIGEDPCEPAAGAKGDFKIALVGGFSAFYLVKSQIAQIYNLDTEYNMDPRLKNVSANKQEQAISLGAALLAAGKVVLQKTARYSIGILSKGIGGKNRLTYGIKFHQLLEPRKPYFLCHENGNRAIYGALHGNITSFAIEFTERMDHGSLMVLKQEMLDKLRQLPEHNFWNLAFSMDESDVISFHIVSAAISGSSAPTEERVIRLDSYSRMFDLTSISEVGDK